MSTPSLLRIAISGYGGIGRRVGALLLARRDALSHRLGADLRLAGICGASSGLVDRNGLTAAALADPAARVAGLTGERFLDEVQADLLVECGPSDIHTGGPGLAYLRGAISRGMEAVAVSKGALVVDARGLLALARRHGVGLRVSGATASALPTIDLLQFNLAGTAVRRLEAILTGTTNHVLSALMDRGCSVAEAVDEARALGIAEPDPSFDLEGWDTACKLAILANVGLDGQVDVRTMPRQGVAGLTPAQVAAWRAEGLTPRLVGRLDLADGMPRAEVALALYPQDHPFARVHGRTKAIHVETQDMGALTVIGGSSDPQATAAAALKDLEHLLRDRLARRGHA